MKELSSHFVVHGISKTSTLNEYCLQKKKTQQPKTGMDLNKEGSKITTVVT